MAATPLHIVIAEFCNKICQKRTSHQRCPMFGRGVPKTAIAPTTSSQNGTTPTPGIASRTSPGKSSHCQPSTTNKSAAVTTSTAHPIGGAKLAKAPMTSDTPAMTKASASRHTLPQPRYTWKGRGRRPDYSFTSSVCAFVPAYISAV
jgi:hypothetical protein